MSRVGKQPVTVPDGVKVAIEEGRFVAEGPKGRVEEMLLEGLDVKIEDGIVTVSRDGETGDLRAKHGLMRALLANAVHGVSQGFSKVLEIHGVGYRASLSGRDINLSLGYSHPVVFSVPDGIEVQVDESRVAGKRCQVRIVTKQVIDINARQLDVIGKKDGVLGAGHAVTRTRVFVVECNSQRQRRGH